MTQNSQIQCNTFIYLLIAKLEVRSAQYGTRFFPEAQERTRCQHQENNYYQYFLYYPHDFWESFCKLTQKIYHYFVHRNFHMVFQRCFWGNSVCLLKKPRFLSTDPNSHYWMKDTLNTLLQEISQWKNLWILHSLNFEQNFKI